MNVTINGNVYAVKGRIKQGHVTRLSSAFRTIGVQQRRDDTSVNRFVQSSWPLGLGWARMNRETGRGVGGYLDTTCDLSHIPAVLGRLQETQTHAAPADHFKKAITFKGDLWGAFEQNYHATLLNGIYVTKFGATADTWVAVDAPMYNDSTAGTAAASSITVSHTVQSTFGNRIAIAILFISNDPGDPTGVTYAGAAMTLFSSQAAGNSNISIWYKVAPATGANNCIASFSGGYTVSMHVSDYFFVNQSSPFGTVAKETGTGTSTSVVVTGTAGDLVIGGVGHLAAEVTAVGTGQVEREDNSVAGLGAESSEERAAGTSTTWSASWVSNVVFFTIAAPLLAAGFVAAPESPGAEGMRVWDMAAHKGSLFLGCNGNPTSEVIYKVLSSTNGDAWVDASGAVFPDDTGANRYLPTSVTRRNNFDDDMLRLCSFGNYLFVALYRHPSSTDGDSLVAIYSTIDSGVNWVSEVTLPSGDGPKAFVDWYAMDGSRAPVLITAEGIYSIDYTNNIPNLIYALDGDPNNGRWAEVDNSGALRVGLGSGQVIVLNITDTGHLTTYFSGPPGDGLVTARQGHVNYMLKTPSRWLMVAYGGHSASHYASIFMIDTQTILEDPESHEWYNPWHHMWEDTTGNLDIGAMAYSTEDDATPRLHFALEGTSASICYHIEEPFAHPDQTTTAKYQASSILRKPVDSLGDPQTNSTITQALVDADGLGATATTSTEYITETYGLEGAADTTTTLGTYLSGAKTLSFGTADSDGTYPGIAAKKIGRRLTFYRNTAGSPDTTKTPKLYEEELQARNVYLDKQFWEFTVDIAESLHYSPVTPVANTPDSETIIAQLEAVEEATTLSTFKIGRKAVTRVLVPNDIPPVWDLEVVESNRDNPGYRTGFVWMRLEQGT